MSESDASLAPEKYETPKKKSLRETSDGHDITPRRSSRVLQSKRVIAEEYDRSSEDEASIDVDERKHFKENFQDIDVDGKTVFGFHTPKKKDGMTTILASVTPKTPKTDMKNRNQQSLKTPKHIRNKTRKGNLSFIFRFSSIVYYL